MKSSSSCYSVKGLLGLCGQSDLRGIIEMSQRGEAKGTLALDIFVYRIKKYIGAYLAALDGQVDGIVFSAGIGENCALIRGMVCNGLQVIDEGRWGGGNGMQVIDEGVLLSLHGVCIRGLHGVCIRGLRAYAKLSNLANNNFRDVRDYVLTQGSSNPAKMP